MREDGEREGGREGGRMEGGREDGGRVDREEKNEIGKSETAMQMRKRWRDGVRRRERARERGLEREG